MPVTWDTLVAMLADAARIAAHLIIAAGNPTGVAVTALAAGVLVGALTIALASGGWLGRIATAVPLIGRAAALRRKSWGAAFLRQRDPDAAGRARPRAPSAAPAAA
jgi:hypothetical protein